MQQVVEAAGEVEHEGGGAGVGLREGDSDGEAADVDAAAEREAGEEAARVGAHVGARLVVVAEADVVVGRGYDVGAEHEVAEEVAFERVLHFRLGSAVAGVEVRQLPLGEVPGRDAEAHGEGAEALRPAQTHVQRQAVVAVVEALDLASEIGYYHR